MAHFSPQFLEQVRAASDIVDIVGAALPLKRAGANFTCLCPFHQEKSPSFNVHPAKQIFHCFGCQAGGDVFKFVQLYENITFPEAVERLAERARIPLETDRDPAARQSRGLKDSLLKLHETPGTRPSQATQQAEALRELADRIEQADLDRILENFRRGRLAELKQIIAICQERRK